MKLLLREIQDQADKIRLGNTTEAVRAILDWSNEIQQGKIQGVTADGEIDTRRYDEKITRLKIMVDTLLADIARHKPRQPC
jgi:hypothetical protein